MKNGAVLCGTAPLPEPLGIRQGATVTQWTDRKLIGRTDRETQTGRK